MPNSILSHIIRFILLVLLQVFVFNNILFFNIINPFVYIYFLILLPFELPPVIIVLLGFLIGITIDFFSGTIAIHALASTVAGYARPFVLKLFSPHDGYEKNTNPTIAYYDIEWWIKYALFITFIHHSVLFIVESFHLNYLIFTLTKIILSSLITIIIMVLMQYFFHKHSKNL
ncbi:MAG: rod shape-determining protein MreD [Bacteroidales bacterium]|nr:rod shape-determining protein MreD [Bacteroidales bacterium]